MARARNIKPGFCQNEDLAELPYETRLAFALLPMFADREGRLDDRPKRIKMQMFPTDNLDMDQVLQSLHDYGFIVRYQVGTCRYIQIVKFAQHQRPHPSEKPSEIPAMDNQGTPDGTPRLSTRYTKDLPNPSSSLNPSSLNPDSLRKESAASPPTLWDAGTVIGIPRPLIGKWIKKHGEEKTAACIAHLSVKRPADPVQYGTAWLQERPAKLYVPKDDNALVAWAKEHNLPDAGKTETYQEYRQRLWAIVKERAA